jgi:threonine synthase
MEEDMELYEERHSVVRRYADRLAGVDPESVRRASLREGARVVQLSPYRGVEIDVLDLSSTGTTGTFKDWLACVAVAECLTEGLRTVIAQSSGNTANALARYASNVGIRCVILYPTASRRRIQPGLAELPEVDFVEVAATEGLIKEALRDYTDSSGIPAAPSLSSQYESNKLRAYFLRDAAAELGRHWNWHVQALSSAYGPFGFYRGVSEIQRSGTPFQTPRFLGIQQEAVAPYAGAIGGLAGDPSAPMIEPTLFRKSLTPPLIAEMQQICTSSGGTVRPLPNSRYWELQPRAIRMLAAAGVSITLDSGGQPRERAGLYSLAGTLDAIDKDLIRPGEQVLAVHTGGSATAAAGSFRPSYVAAADNVAAVISAALAEQGQLAGLRRP